MTTVEVVLKQSFTQRLFILLLFGFCLFIIFYLLHTVLFYGALILWGIAFAGMLLSYLLSRKLYTITLIETMHTRKINLRYGDQWYNDVTLRRSIMIAGALYLECKVRLPA